MGLSLIFRLDSDFKRKQTRPYFLLAPSPCGEFTLVGNLFPLQNTTIEEQKQIHSVKSNKLNKQDSILQGTSNLGFNLLFMPSNVLRF